MADICLTIVCRSAHAERVLDTLLTMREIALFTSQGACAHGLEHAALSATEQVMGMAKMTRVDALLSHATSTSVLERLRAELAGTGLKYWLTPIIEAGEFS